MHMNQARSVCSIDLFLFLNRGSKFFIRILRLKGFLLDRCFEFLDMTKTNRCLLKR